ncbi:MAG: hypothetical protein WCH11_03785, partial [Bdellovibrio sp.]
MGGAAPHSGSARSIFSYSWLLNSIPHFFHLLSEPGEPKNPFAAQTKHLINTLLFGDFIRLNQRKLNFPHWQSI